MKQIITGITKQLRTVTDKVYFYDLPNIDNTEDHSIVFTVTNPEKISVIENTEALNIYDVQININSASVTNNLIGNNESERVLNLVQPVKNAMQKLPNNYLKCVNEDFFFDNLLDVYTHVLRYEIHA